MRRWLARFPTAAAKATAHCCARGRNRGRAHRDLDEQRDELHVAQRELPVEVRADRADVAAGGRAGLQELRQAGLALGQAVLLLETDAERGLPCPDDLALGGQRFER
jgi:hypothetical protein